MVIYETIKLKEAERLVLVFRGSDEEQVVRGKSAWELVQEYNEQGYMLTAVNGNDYYLTKRID